MDWLLIARLMQQLLPVAIEGIHAVQQATGKSPEEALNEVVDHLTPGKPASPTLSAAAAPPA